MAIGLATYVSKKGLSKADCYVRVAAVHVDDDNENAAVQMGVYADEASANPAEGPRSQNRIDIQHIPVPADEISGFCDKTKAEVYAWVKTKDATLAAGSKVGD